MVRLSRAEQQERTHAQLLDAGREVFLRRGFLATTVEEIAAAAGYTRGAVYKHFGGKEGLWQAIVEARATALSGALRSALATVGSRAELVSALNPAALVAGEEATRWTAAAAEYLAAVAGKPRHAEPLAELQRSLDAGLAAALTETCDRLGLRPALPTGVAVTALGALGGGLALLVATDPAVDVAAVTAGVVGLLFPEPS